MGIDMNYLMHGGKGSGRTPIKKGGARNNESTLFVPGTSIRTRAGQLHRAEMENIKGNGEGIEDPEKNTQKSYAERLREKTAAKLEASREAYRKSIGIDTEKSQGERGSSTEASLKAVLERKSKEKTEAKEAADKKAKELGEAAAKEREAEAKAKAKAEAGKKKAEAKAKAEEKKAEEKAAKEAEELKDLDRSKKKAETNEAESKAKIQEYLAEKNKLSTARDVETTAASGRKLLNDAGSDAKKLISANAEKKRVKEAYELDLSKYSTKELNDMTARLNAEAAYRSARISDEGERTRVAKASADALTGIAGLAVSAVGAYYFIKKLKGD